VRPPIPCSRLAFSLVAASLLVALASNALRARADGAASLALQVLSLVLLPPALLLLWRREPSLRQTQDAREVAARYQAIVDMAVDAIITIDERGIIDSVNRAAERLFGYRSQELLGRNVSVLMPPPYRQEHDGYIARYLETSQPHIIGIGREVVAQRKDGSLFPVELAVSEVPVAGRRLFTGSLRDLTQRRRAEVLAQIGTLASGLAHEIGTPMNVILARAELLKERLLDGQSARHLDIINQQVERVSKLMNQLLALSRPHELERRSTDLNRVVQEVIEALQERLGRRRIALELGLDPVLPRAELDPNQMLQLALNLTINAIDAMSGGGSLRLATRHGRGEVEGRAIEFVELEVRDTGCGIPAEHLLHIFTPFFTTKEPGHGTGLGLSVVQGIVRDHAGETRVESEPGRGTSFRVRLPVSAGTRPG
jgi:PAS domain S-box-containing protein